MRSLRPVTIAWFTIVAPTTMPTVRARNTATSDTKWNRKLIMIRSQPRTGPSEPAAHRRPEVGEHDPEAVEEHAERVGRDRHDHHHEQGGSDEQEEVAEPHPALVEPVDALRVDEHRPEAQMGEEGRLHAAPALVEELDHRRVRADRDDERRAC